MLDQVSPSPTGSTATAAAAALAAFGGAQLAPEAAPQAPQSAVPSSQPPVYDPSRQQPQATPAAGADGLPAQAQPDQGAVDPSQAAQPHGQQDQGMVPSFRVREEASARRAAEDQARRLALENAEMQGMLRAVLAGQQPGEPQPAPQAPQPPDMYTDPVGYAEWMQTQIETAARNAMRQEAQAVQAQASREKLATSDMRARMVYGDQADALIADATHAAVQAGLRDRFMATSDPVGNAIRWHQQQVAAQRYGSDPATVRTRVAQELMNDPTFMQQMAAKLGVPVAPQAANPQVPPGVPPPSLSAAPRHGQVMPAAPMQATQTALESMFSSRRNAFGAGGR